MPARSPLDPARHPHALQQIALAPLVAASAKFRRRHAARWHESASRYNRYRSDGSAPIVSVHLASQKRRDVVLIVFFLVAAELETGLVQRHRLDFVTARLLTLPSRRVEIIDDGTKVNDFAIFRRGAGDVRDTGRRGRLEFEPPARLLSSSRFAETRGDHGDADLVASCSRR